MSSEKIYAIVNYEDEYIQPLLTSALKRQLPADLLVLIHDISELPSGAERLLQWRQYESVNFDDLMARPTLSFANSFVIRKALIRKHYLASTVSHWSAKNPDTILQRHIKRSVEFEVDYAEFLDDALIEAYELKESWEKNDSLPAEAQKEWWILKPGMSDRGQGIRLFSSESDLQAIFEEWDPPSDDEDEDEDASSQKAQEDPDRDDEPHDTHHASVMTSHLRHFVAQSYVHPPLILSQVPPSSGCKFHIRTYVLAVGALQVYVYRPMLALFAAGPYTAPGTSPDPNHDLGRHLTNTCLQSGEREGNVHAFWSLPARVAELPAGGDWREDVFRQICAVTGEIFEAAARSMSVHFQPLPNAFEVFGLDFLVDAEGTAWLLEVNAFPDFAQTGQELQSLVQGLVDDVVRVAIRPFFGLEHIVREGERMCKVLDIDLGRR